MTPSRSLAVRVALCAPPPPPPPAVFLLFEFVSTVVDGLLSSGFTYCGAVYAVCSARGSVGVLLLLTGGHSI